MTATYSALTGVSAFANNKLHFVLHNANASGWAIQIMRVVLLPQATAVTGALSGEWTLRRRAGTTTAPSGTGGVSIVAMDTATPLPAGISAWNSPQTGPAGGSLESILTGFPQSEEMKSATLDAPTMASLQPFGGVSLYDGTAYGAGSPLTLRVNETLELVQGTGNVGNVRVFSLFHLVG